MNLQIQPSLSYINLSVLRTGFFSDSRYDFWNSEPHKVICNYHVTQITEQCHIY